MGYGELSLEDFDLGKEHALKLRVEPGIPLFLPQPWKLVGPWGGEVTLSRWGCWSQCSGSLGLFSSSPGMWGEKGNFGEKSAHELGIAGKVWA